RGRTTKVQWRRACDAGHGRARAPEAQCADTRRASRMVNKSLLMGVALGVGFATAGGVTAYQFLGVERTQGGTAMIEDDATAHDAHAEHGSSTHEEHASSVHDSQSSSSAAALAPTRTAEPATVAAPKIGRASCRERDTNA